MAFEKRGWDNNSQSNPWYDSNLPPLNDAAIKVFTQYCGIPRDQVLDHVAQIREKAWQNSPFPCVGLWLFIQFELASMPQYPEVLDRVKHGQSFLDLGCGMGQDLRLLAAEGAPSNSLFASDLKGDFWEIGFDLFKDRETFQANFAEADVFADDQVFSQWQGKLDIVHAADLLHLFDLEQQEVLAVRILSVLKKRRGSLVLGRQVGTHGATARMRQSSAGAAYRHTTESMKQLWLSAGQKSGLDLEVGASTADYQDIERSSKARGTVADPMVRVIFAARIKSLGGRSSL